MKNRRHWFIYLSLLASGILLFVYQGNFKSVAPQFGRARTTPIPEPLPALLPDTAREADFQSAATGSQFTGEKFRTFTEYIFRDAAEAGNLIRSSSNPETDKNCDKWGVMTTITSPPTEAIRRFLYKPDWCVVVVADLNKPNVRLLLTSKLNVFNYINQVS